MNLFRSGHLSRSACCALSVAIGFLTACGGCEQKEKVLDIKAPGVDVEVNKTTSPTSEGLEIKTNGTKRRIEKVEKIQIEKTP